MKHLRLLAMLLVAATIAFTACSDDGGNNGGNNGGDGISDSTAPAEVIGLNATAGNGQITLTWTDPAEADFDHVNISYGINGTADTAFSGTINPSATVISGLINFSKYTFVIKTVDKKGNVSSGTTITTTPGFITYDGGNGADAGYSVVIDANDNALIAGFITSDTGKDMALWRYTSSGALDSSFGTGGVVIYENSHGDDYGRSVEIDAAGNVLVAGEITNTNRDMAIWRYTSSGVLDTGFGSGGIAVFHSSIYDIGYSLVIDANGKLLIAGFVAGSDSFDMYLWRYLSSGVLDVSFGTGGYASYSSCKGADMAYSLAADANGKVIVAGYLNNGTDSDMTVLRYTSSGTLDTSFGNNGAVTYDGVNGNDAGKSTAIDSNGNIVVTGYFNTGTDDMALWYMR